jgi:hypothetical protein
MVKGAAVAKLSVVIVYALRCGKFVFKVFTLVPYIMVASTPKNP